MGLASSIIAKKAAKELIEKEAKKAAAGTVNIGRRFSDRELTQAKSTNSAAVTKEGLTNKSDKLPSLRADVMKDQASDISVMTGKGKKPTTSELTAATRAAAEERAMTRTAGRAGAVAGAGAAGFGVGSGINAAIAKEEPASKQSKAKDKLADERTNKEDFPVYKKGTESADTFQKAFKDAKKEGKDSFSFEGRKYNTKEDKKEMSKGGSVTAYAKGGVVKANCGASVPPTQKARK